MSKKVQHGVQQVKRCCSTCDTKQLCHICGGQTQYACSDCRIDFGVTIWVCPTKKCRDAHEQKCPYTLRHRIEELLKALRGLLARHCDGSEEKYWAEWDTAQELLKESTHAN